MTLSEKQAWLSLAAILLVGGYCVANFTEGWTIPDQPARSLWRTWIGMLLAGTLAEIAIGIWAGNQRAKGALSDERDAAIAARADRIAMGAAFVGVNVLVWQGLWQASFSDTARQPLLAMPDLTHLPTLIFALLMVLVIAHGLKQAAVIALGRI